jgi:hypothetical protein
MLSIKIRIVGIITISFLKIQKSFLSNRYITSLPFCQFYVFPEIPSFSLFSLCSNWHSSIFDMFCRSHLMPCPCRNNSHSKTLPHLEHSSVICLPKINMAMTPYLFCKRSEVFQKLTMLFSLPLTRITMLVPVT